MEVYRSGPHHGEEPPISGLHGSGTVFFSRCTLRCVYCQNFPWSQQGKGTPYSEDGLTGILRTLADAGCHNWNLVSPTPWLPMIRQSLAALHRDSVRRTVVYNTSGFERIETLHEYAEIADVFLVDLRYANENTAAEGSGCHDYVAYARAAVQAMWELVGPLRLDSRDVAVGGVICRLLVLPGRAQEAIDNLEWLASRIGTEVSVSVMGQYVPAHRAVNMIPWNRRVEPAEYAIVREAVEDLGFDRGWVQELDVETPDDLVGFRMEEGASR